MKYSYIWEFISIADSLNFNDASLKTGLPVQTLLRHLRSMEDELGVSLIKPNNTQSIELTEYGQAFLPYAAQLQAVYNTSTEITRGRHDSNRLLIAVNTRCKYVRDTYILPWLEENSGAKLYYVSQYTNRLYDAVLHRECDLAVVCKIGGDTTLNAMEEIPFANGWVDAIMRPDNPLADSDRVFLTDLVNCGLHVLESDIRWVLQLFFRNDIHVFFKRIHPDVQSLIAGLEKGDIALMVDEQSKLLSEDIRHIPLIKSPPVTYEIIHLPDNRHPLIAKFVEDITSQIS